MMQGFFEIDHLTKRFGGLLAVDDVSFSVNQGEIFTIIGPNGAGKTTIFNLISLIYPASAGQIRFLGKDLGHMSPDQVVQLGIGRTFQNIELFAQATVLQNLLIGRHAHTPKRPLAEMFFTRSVRDSELVNRRAVEKVIDFLDLAAYRDATVAGLPYGVRKVVELARALCTEPKLLLLDEPCAGLSPAERQRLFKLIAGLPRSLTMLMIEHDMDVALGLADRITVLHRGQIILEGGVEEVRVNPQVREVYFGQV